MTGQWLRDTLDPHPVPAPDLADRAERTARRIVRRRVAAGALAAAALAAVAVPLAGGDADGDRTAGPLPTTSPAPACQPAYGSTLTVVPDPARSARDAAWPYRGEADLRPAATALGRGLADARPLFGAHLPAAAGDVTMAVGRSPAGWRLRYAVAGRGRAENALPVLGPTTQLSLVVPTTAADGGAVVVIVAAPGTRSIDYLYCRAGGPLDLMVEDDTFVQEAGPDGEIQVTARDGTVTALGVPGTGATGAEPVPPIPVPPGHRALPVRTGAGHTDYAGTETVTGARVLVRCRAAGGALETEVGRVRCDGLVQVAADALTLRPGYRLVSHPGRYDVRVLVPDE